MLVLVHTAQYSPTSHMTEPGSSSCKNCFTLGQARYLREKINCEFSTCAQSLSRKKNKPGVGDVQ